MNDLFAGMAVGPDLYPSAVKDAGDILKKVGVISIGSIGGAMARDKALQPLLGNALWATVAEAGVGVLGAAVLMNGRSELPFWLFVGVGVHGVTDLLRQLLGTTGFLPSQ